MHVLYILTVVITQSKNNYLIFYAFLNSTKLQKLVNFSQHIVAVLKLEGPGGKSAHSVLRTQQRTEQGAARHVLALL